MDPLAWRPCGACGELVPADTGCTHWKPDFRRQRAAMRKRDRDRLAAREAKDAESLRRLRQQDQEKALRADARTRVAEFHRMMGVGQ